MLPDSSVFIEQRLVENAKIKKKNQMILLSNFQTMWYRCAISNAILLKVNIQMLLMVLFIILRRAVLCESAYNRSIERWRCWNMELACQ